MAADPPEGINLSNLIALDDSQLGQVRGQGWEVLLPRGLSLNIGPFSRDTAVKQMAPFHLQYLSIQQKIQQEIREFNLLSNIMKERHEAAKNSINNIR
jgi:hypothetical protein